MNLATSISIYAGGPGSGCNPAAGKCGRTAVAEKNDGPIKYDGWVTKDGEFIRRHGTHRETALASGLASNEYFATRDALANGNIRVLGPTPPSPYDSSTSAGIEVQSLDEDTRERVALIVERMGFPGTVMVDVREPKQSAEFNGRQVYQWMKTGVPPRRSKVAQFHTMDASHPKARAGIKLQGFTNAEQEQIRQVLSEIPSKCLRYTKVIKADPSLGAKHGRYNEPGIVHLNTRDFGSKVKFGHGPGRKLPHVDLTLAHEVGHSVFLSLSPKQQEQWNNLSGWQKGEGEGQAPPYKEKRPGWPKETSMVTHREGVGFTRHYAERNNEEDWADSFGFFVMGQKGRLPENKRAFLEKVLR